jgi:D-arginine dehydrogenase
MDADFLIIGGGIAGISAAARLSELGSVLLLEAESAFAHHASGRSAALYEPHYGAPAVVGLSMASGPDFRARESVLSPRGLMLVAKASAREAYEHDLKKMAFDPITVDEARAIVPILNPDVVALAGYAAHAEDIDTDLLLQGFLRDARSRGARALTGAKVTAIAKRTDGWQVTSAAGTFTGRMLVNAAGAWVDQVAAMAGVRPLGFTPNRRSMARIPAPGGHDVSGWPMIFGPGEDWYCKPDAGALIVSPPKNTRWMRMTPGPMTWCLAEGLARYEEMMTEPVTRLISNWAGLRTFASDRVLVIGPDLCASRHSSGLRDKAAMASRPAPPPAVLLPI